MFRLPLRLACVEQVLLVSLQLVSGGGWYQIAASQCVDTDCSVISWFMPDCLPLTWHCLRLCFMVMLPLIAVMLPDFV